jgi:hypothetical protein
MSAKQSLTSTILFFFLLGCVCSINWQGAGNMSASNMTFIWSTINANIPNYVSAAKTNLSQFSVVLSNAFNQAWSPAWNVFVFELLDPSVDAIFYGYSFNGHWMWFNDYAYQGRYFSFVIWKDYNCKVWNTIDNSMLQTAFTANDANANIYTTITKALTALQASPITVPFSAYEEIWEHTKLLTNQMQIINPSKTYSIVAIKNGFMDSTDAINSMNGRFCTDGAASSYLFTKVSSIESSTGFLGLHKMIILEMASR